MCTCTVLDFFKHLSCTSQRQIIALLLGSARRSSGEEVQPGDAALLRAVPVGLRRRRVEPAHPEPDQPARGRVHHPVVHLQQRRHHQRQARFFISFSSVISVINQVIPVINRVKIVINEAINFINWANGFEYFAIFFSIF